MAYNNFKETIPTFYVSKAGNDSNDGLSPDSPKKSLLTAAQATEVYTSVGAGYYEVSFTTPTNGVQLIGDGKVIIDMLGTSLSLQIQVNASYPLLKNLELRNGEINNNVFGTFIFFQDLILKGITKISGRAFNCTRIIFIDCPVVAASKSSSDNYSYTILINTQIPKPTAASGFALSNSYLDPSSSLFYGGAASAFRNNNIQGIIGLEIASSAIGYYAIQDQYVGTPQDNGYAAGVEWLTEAQLTADGYTGTVSGWNTAVATCMNRDPMFNDVSGEDFTLQAGSPHIRAANDGVSNIGGTKVGISVINTDEGNAAGTRVIPSAEIDTTIPLAYQLLPLETEGYVDYVVRTSGFVIEELRLKDMFRFDSDFAGGGAENNNVADSQPLTVDYAALTQTSGAPGTLNEIIVPENLIIVGNHVRVNGQHREVLSKVNSTPNDTLTLDTDLAGAIGSGIDVSYGTELQLASLNPNRLTVLMRTRSSSATPTIPFVDAEWDNEIDPSYDVVGDFFQQEVDNKPALIIDGLNVYGRGDSTAPTGLAETDLAPEWVHVRVYKRNNYSSSGI